MADNQAAYYWNAVREARDRISSDPTLSVFHRSRLLAEMEKVRTPPGRQIPYGQVVQTLYNAGLSAGGAFLGGRLLGLPKPAVAGLAAAGFGLGTLWSMGSTQMNKISATDDQDAVNAFKLGFLKSARDAGYFHKEAAGVIVNPADILSIPQNAARSARGFLSGAGNVAGAAVAPTAADGRLAELEVEEEMLRRQLADLRERKTTRRLKQLLRQRRR